MKTENISVDRNVDNNFSLNIQTLIPGGYVLKAITHSGTDLTTRFVKITP